MPRTMQEKLAEKLEQVVDLAKARCPGLEMVAQPASPHAGHWYVQAGLTTIVTIAYRFRSTDMWLTFHGPVAFFDAGLSVNEGCRRDQKARYDDEAALAKAVNTLRLILKHYFDMQDKEEYR